MLNIRNLPIEPPPINLSKPKIAPVELSGEIAKKFPKESEKPHHGYPSQSPTTVAKSVSYPPTLGGNVDLRA